MMDEHPSAHIMSKDSSPKGRSSIDAQTVLILPEKPSAAIDLVTTEEGKQHIEKTIKDTQTQIQKSFDDIISRIKDELDKKVKNVK